ncbi:substrate-binding periplasmic protein [Thalassotalea atypica]|uniref:substrate-binding periplasmic protein n=1 Tax=Thalassotalea atypica TaxID=2054316 RepID=UPI0025737CE0|nr:transporter substrate-binding domain-containing protein [Thalassotalea atypica]
MRLIYFIYFYCVAHLGCFAADGNKILLYTEQFPPYNYTVDGTHRGINLELIELMCQRVKLQCRYEFLPWGRALQAAQLNVNAGIFSTSRYAERESLFHWVGPLVASESYFYRLKSRQDITIADSKDLLKYTVAAPRNDVYVDLLMAIGFTKGKNLLLMSKKYGDVEHFFSEKVDLFIASPLTLSYHTGNKPHLVESIWPLEITRLHGNYLAFNKGIDATIVKQFSAALQALNAEGVPDKLIKKYSNK